jgi:hypothetical protein
VFSTILEFFMHNRRCHTSGRNASAESVSNTLRRRMRCIFLIRVRVYVPADWIASFRFLKADPAELWQTLLLVEKRTNLQCQLCSLFSSQFSTCVLAAENDVSCLPLLSLHNRQLQAQWTFRISTTLKGRPSCCG